MAPLKAKKKAEPKAKAKPAVKARPKAAPKVKAAPRKTAKPRAATAAAHAGHGLTAEQKAELLNLIARVVELRKGKTGGLRTFFMIDRILDSYNQKYKLPNEKFDAIVSYGVEKQNGVTGTDIYVFVNGREKDENSLYELLSAIDQEKIKFAEIRQKLQEIFTESQTKK